MSGTLESYTLDLNCTRTKFEYEKCLAYKQSIFFVNIIVQIVASIMGLTVSSRLSKIKINIEIRSTGSPI